MNFREATAPIDIAPLTMIATKLDGELLALELIIRDPPNMWTIRQVARSASDRVGELETAIRIYFFDNRIAPEQLAPLLKPTEHCQRVLERAAKLIAELGAADRLAALLRTGGK